MIYPVVAMQCISGVFTTILAKSYVGAQWIDWTVYLYNDGDQCENLTGGWIEGASDTKNVGAFTISDSGMVLVTSTSARAQAETALAVDLSDVKTVYASVTITKWPTATASPNTLCLAYASSPGANVATNAVTKNELSKLTLGNHTISLDVSSVSGSVYVILALRYGGGEMTVNKVWIE